MAKILTIDDDTQILSVIKRTLEKDGHIVTTKESAASVEENQLYQYDIILLDVMMPDVDGFSFCKKIRDLVDCPILFLTAKTLDEDLCEGLMCGGDDYIKKPFSIIELRARVKAHLRREGRENHYQLSTGNFRFDLSAKVIYADGVEIRFTKSEYEICEFLAKNKGQVFSLEQMIEQILGYDSESDKSAIREHIKNIRSKLSELKENPIETVWGIGYKWQV